MSTTSKPSLGPALAVMVKEPSLGAKTRLSDALSPADRRALCEAFLHDKVEQVLDVAGAQAVVAFTPPDATERLRALVGGGPRLLAQRGEDLGERLANVARDLLCQGHDGVLLVDGDTPNLPPEHLHEALAALAHYDLVLGPSWDGGYYLIGMRQFRAELFAGVPWSTADVLAATVTKARHLGMGFHLLPAWYDVDTPTDLDRLALQLRATPFVRPGFPRHTAWLLERLRPAPPQHNRDEHWRTICSRRSYQNRWLRLDESVVDIGLGKLTLYGVVTCPGGVGVVPILPDGKLVLVRQFRYVAQRFTWEIPTGGPATGEELDDAARRELREETGYLAGSLRKLGAFHTSKSIMDEVAHLYVGEDLVVSHACPDETEQLEVGVFAFDEALEMIASGEIVDSMSVVALLMLSQKKREGEPNTRLALSVS